MISLVLRDPRPRDARHRLSGREPQCDGLTLMDAVEQDLKAAVEGRYGGRACLAYIDAVSVTVRGKSVWDGVVLVFDLEGQPEIERAYAWFSPARGGDERRLHVVPHAPPIRSAQDAVTATLLEAIRLADPPNARMSA